MTSERRKKATIMALRCGYISIDGAYHLKKATPRIPVWAWRLIHKIKCYWSRRHQEDVFQVLDEIHKRIPKSPFN